MSTVLALAMLAIACGRTGLYPGDAEQEGASGAAGGTMNWVPADGTGGPALPLGGAAAMPTGGRGGAPNPMQPACEPSTEECNGRDDDCNGAVDDLPAEACPGGGFRFCVAGRRSECPQRCEVCVPGSSRVCMNPFCTFWGEQECAADGQGFGPCREIDAPPECAAIAIAHQDSPELERCCIDNGYCCLDEHDLDRDGSRKDMLGTCGDVACN